MDTTLNETLLWLEAHYGDAEAVVDWPDGRRWTFAELSDRARRLAAAYRDAGIGRGDRVGWLALGSRADLVALVAGARKLGAVPVVMNARASAERVAWMLEHAGVRSLAYTGDCAELLGAVRSAGMPSVRSLIALDAPTDLPGETPVDDLYASYAGAEEPGIRTEPEEICLLAYTSGTTGRPKLVVHLESEWAWTTLTMAYVLGLYHEDTALIAMPPNFIGWAHVTCASLRVGARQCCFRFDPAMFRDVVAAEGGTHALLTPTLIRMLYARFREERHSRDASTLRVAVIGGEPVTADVAAMLDEMFPDLIQISAFGATEGILLHTRSFGSSREARAGAAGRPLPGVTAVLRDEETGELITEPGRRGILHVRGPGIAAGIWNDPEATAISFPNGWWRTGDLFTRDREGYLYYAGRADHMFKSGGIKVYAEEVEEALKRHPDVLDAVVVPVPDPTFGLVPFAHVRNTRPLEPQVLERWWREQGLERYSRPRHWRFWGEEPFPMVTPAKVDRHRLAEEARAATEAVAT